MALNKNPLLLIVAFTISLLNATAAIAAYGEYLNVDPVSQTIQNKTCNNLFNNTGLTTTQVDYNLPTVVWFNDGFLPAFRPEGYSPRILQENGKSVEVTRLNDFTIPDKLYTKFLKQVYKDYSGKIQDDIIKVVKESDKQLSSKTISFVTIKDGNRFVGSMRIVRSSGDEPLPYEIALRSRGLNSKRPPHEGSIVEIGKFIINTDNRTQRNEIRNKLLSWLKSKIWSEDYLYVVHVASKAHLELYQKQYGFRIFDEIKNHGATEFILEITDTELEHRLNQILQNH